MDQYQYPQINPIYNPVNVVDLNCQPNKIETDITSPPLNSCKCENMEKKLEDIKVSMQQQMNTVQGQLKLALDALEEQREILQQLLKSREEALLEQALPLHTKFPLKNEDELLQLNDEITPENRNQYIKAIESLLHPEGIRKNLKNIISTDITIDYNVDGVHGKKPFKTLENFYALLMDAIPVTSTSGAAEMQFRKAIQLQKKRHLKKLSVSKHAYELEDDDYDSDFDGKLLLRKRLKQHDPLDIIPKARERDKESAVFKKFPLETEKQLIELNAAITPSNRSLYIKVMKSLLHPDGVRKNLKNLLSSDITLAYNVEGVQNKKSFKSLSNFYRTLIDSIVVTSESGTAEIQLRNAIQLQKKRHFKRMSVMKRKLEDD